MANSGYSINAQRPTAGKPTTGGSPVHDKMKPSILPQPKEIMGDACFNKDMYKKVDGSTTY